MLNTKRWIVELMVLFATVVFLSGCGQKFTDYDRMSEIELRGTAFEYQKCILAFKEIVDDCCPT